MPLAATSWHVATTSPIEEVNSPMSLINIFMLQFSFGSIYRPTEYNGIYMINNHSYSRFRGTTFSYVMLVIIVSDIMIIHWAIHYSYSLNALI